MKRRMFKFLIVLCCFALLVGSARAFIGEERLLLKRAVPLKIEHQEDTPEGSYLWQHWWTPDSETLEFHIKEQAHKPPVYSLLRHNLHTGHTTSISIPFGEELDQRYSNPALSPDGQWLMWNMLDDKETVHVWNIATKQRLSWPTGGDDYRHFTNYWLADSRHWLEYVTVPRYVTLHDIQNPRSNVRMTLPPLPNGQNMYDAYMDVILTSHNHLLTCDNQLDQNTSETIGLILHELALQPEQGKVVPLKTYRVMLPKGLRYINHTISPSGDRILWNLEDKRESPIQHWMRRVLPKTPPRKQTWVALYTSRLDGSDWREVGHIVVPQADNGDDADKWDTDNLLYAHWLPDGKTVWLEYQEKYYSVAVD